MAEPPGWSQPWLALDRALSGKDGRKLRSDPAEQVTGFQDPVLDCPCHLQSRFHQFLVLLCTEQSQDSSRIFHLRFSHVACRLPGRGRGREPRFLRDSGSGENCCASVAWFSLLLLCPVQGDMRPVVFPGHCYRFACCDTHGLHESDLRCLLASFTLNTPFWGHFVLFNLLGETPQVSPGSLAFC